MGVLYAKVAGSWIPISGNATGDGAVGPPGGSTYVTEPAEAGPRADAVAQARFGNVNEASKVVGFIAPSVGDNLVINANGQAFAIFDRDAGGASYREAARFYQGDSRLGGWRFHNSPHTGIAILPTANDPTSGYTILAAYGSTYLNAPTSGSLNFRIGNNQVGTSTASTWTINPTLSCNAISCGAINTNGQNIITANINASTNIDAPTFNANSGNRTGNWAGSHFTAYNGAGDLGGARVGFFASNAAAQWWLAYPNGNALSAMNADLGGTVVVIAAGFTTSSALAIKKDVRTLRPERERITVQRDPASDLVAQPDIMALRPVAFRQRQLMQLDGKDYPADTVLGRETRRERLGLIADEVQHVIPSAVAHNTDNEVVGIDYAQITVALLDHVQELTRTVETLQYRIAELEGTQP